MGDFQAQFSRPDTGINTVEGNVAGSRAAGLSKKRAAEQLEFEEKRAKIKADADRQKLGIDAKFDTNTNVSKEEQTFRSKTVGLVTAQEFRKASAEVEKARKGKKGIFGEDLDDDDDRGDDEGGGRGLVSEKEQKKLDKERKKAKRKKLKEKKKRMATLSFAGDEEVDNEEEEDDDDAALTNNIDNNTSSKTKPNGTTQKTIMKNPEVDTSFLPDQEREQRATAERERLRREWLEKQKAMKDEILEITYSYWDGKIMATPHAWLANSLVGKNYHILILYIYCNIVNADILTIFFYLIHS